MHSKRALRGRGTSQCPARGAAAAPHHDMSCAIRHRRRPTPRSSRLARPAAAPSDDQAETGPCRTRRTAQLASVSDLRQYPASHVWPSVISSGCHQFQLPSVPAAFQPGVGAGTQPGRGVNAHSAGRPPGRHARPRSGARRVRPGDQAAAVETLGCSASSAAGPGQRIRPAPTRSIVRVQCAWRGGSGGDQARLDLVRSRWCSASSASRPPARSPCSRGTSWSGPGVRRVPP